MTGFHHRWFIQHYATTAQPQTETTKKNQPDLVEWTATAELAFQQLQSMLTSAPDEESRFHTEFYSTDRCARHWNWSCSQPGRE